MRALRHRAAALLLLLPLVLGGCGGQDRPYAVEDVRALLDAGVFSGEMEAVDQGVLPLLYGVDEATIVDCKGYLALNASVSADEVAVLVLTDEAAAQTAQEALQARVESQLETCRSYCPQAVPSLEAAVVDRVGNTVLLAVGDPETLPGAVAALGK